MLKPEELPLTKEDQQLLKDVFSAVNRNFLRYTTLYVFLLAMLFGNIGLTIFVYQKEAGIPLFAIIISILLILLMTAVYRYMTLYYTHRKRLLRDQRGNLKYVFIGQGTSHRAIADSLVYQVNGYDVSVTNRYTLLGWKVEQFAALEDTAISLHILPASRLLLQVVYRNLASESFSEHLPLQEEQIKAFAQLPKKDRPTQQLLHHGIVTEQLTFIFTIFLFKPSVIIPPYTFRKRNIRLGNELLSDVDQNLRIGQKCKVVEFL